MREQLIGGGYLVRLKSGSLAVEGVPASRRGLIVESAMSYANGSRHERGSYRLSRRVVAGTDLWHVRSLGAVEAL